MRSTRDFKIESTTAADLPAELHDRILSAMNQAADEERLCRKMESYLRRLRPAELTSQLAGRIGIEMYVTADSCRKKTRRLYWLRGSAAVAAAVVMLAAYGLPIMGAGSAVAEGGDYGNSSRRVLDYQNSDKSEWRRDAAPTRSYDVLYEDSIELDIEGTKAFIRVPVTREIEAEEDYL